MVRWSGQAHLEHVGEVASDALEQHAVRQEFGTLSGSHVSVTLSHQSSYLLQHCPCIHIVTQSRVNAFFLLIETRHKNNTESLRLEREHIHNSRASINNLPAEMQQEFWENRHVFEAKKNANLLFSSISSASHFSNCPVISVGVLRISFTFRKNSYWGKEIHSAL